MKLRIISGIYKGRQINVPKSEKVRPTTDRVRESLFNILTNKIVFYSIKILDLYAGSGSLGLECLSRGASEVHFVEQDFIIYKNLEQNISSLNAENSCKIFKTTANRFSSKESKTKYNLILADPPFFKNDIYNVVKNIIHNKYLAKDAIMIIERSIQTKEKDIEYLKQEPFKIIGDNCLYEISN
ncbi:MAG: 16S rRNA (guanine(966)-N(2))-methyltransferase RsmD [Ignavibacteriaceae bacterium]|nr:16S rRNA (guanine(966)-N(2))-methyltransferase RsmD [Ignavibacteriaceae bacterium]